MDYDAKTVCRLCLIKPEYSENVICTDTFKEKLLTIFKIDVDSHSDQLSSLVCTCCLQIVENFSSFYEKVVANQATLLQQQQMVGSTVRKCESPIEMHEDEDDDDDDEVDRLDVTQDQNSQSDDNNTTGESFVDTKLEILHIDVDAKPRVTRSKHRRSSTNRNNDTDDEDSSSECEPKKPVKMLKRRRQVESDYDDRIREFMTLVCDQCEKHQVYDTFKQLSDHFKHVHQSRGYITCCDKKFYRKDILVSHITGHINPEAYKCELCGKISKSKSLLATHMKVHLPVEQREYECPTCHQRFATKSHLAKHKISHLPDSEKKFSCDECGKAFGVKNALTQHKLTHSSERNFVCEDCGRSFAVKSYLQNHINNIHNDEPKPKLQCHICQSWFKNNDTLRKHVRQHNDQTEYKCEYCDKICSSRDVWWCHVRFVHKKIRQHECNICERKFRRRYELTEHMAKHTGQPLYKCQYCARQFMYSSHFSQHRKKCQLLAQEHQQQHNHLQVPPVLQVAENF